MRDSTFHAGDGFLIDGVDGKLSECGYCDTVGFDDPGSLSQAVIEGISGFKPTSDSGAVVSCYPRDYSSSPLVSLERLVFKTVLGERMTHHGMKRDVIYCSKHGDFLPQVFQVTNCTRPITSVRDMRKNGQLKCFGPGVCKIIKDPAAIAKVETILDGVNEWF